MKKNKKNLLKQALRHLLQPLVRLLLQHGVSHREFVDLSKRVFFESGRKILEAQPAKISHSQLAVLTGLHRKDITSLMEEAEGSEESPKESSPLFAVIAEWMTNPIFLDKHKVPLKLPYASTDTKTKTFTMLVESVSKDVRAKVHLEELQRLGLVDVDADNLLTLKKEAFLPTQDFTNKLRFFTRQIHDHMAASATNMELEHGGHFDRSAFHDGLSEAAILELRTLVNTEGMELLKKVYRRAEELATTDKGRAGPRHRMTLGMYLYDEQEEKHGTKK
ncbi:MAG: DUF6502 family protein [Alphaproteobacteria bacterium]|nr:DUF6502 family protein [Alphaproteobacteria bacterium]